MATLTATIAYGQPIGSLVATIGTPGPQGIPGQTGATGATGATGPAGPAAVWGNITGTLSNQTDLWSSLGGKLATASNLSELTATASTARTNLGLGTMAVAASSNYSTTTVANSLYYPLTGNPSGFLTSAPVTSVAGRTGSVTLSNTDISGLGTLSVVNDAPSDGNPYVRIDGGWEQLIIT